MSKKEWCTVAPILDSFKNLGNIEQQLPFSKGVLLEPIPSWVKREEITKQLSACQREELKDEIKYVFSKKYTVKSLDEPDSTCKGKRPRTVQQDALDSIRLTNLALWLSKPSTIGFNLVIDTVLPLAFPYWEAIHHGFPRLIPNESHLKNKLSRSNLEFAQELNSALAKIPTTSNSSIWIACRTLWTTLTQEEWEVRYLLFWVVMEALFGPKDAREIRHRLSQRVAFFLAPDNPKEARNFSVKVLNGYKWRSKVVHGMHLSKLSSGESGTILLEIEDFVRKSLNKILCDKDLIKIFSSKERETYLDDQIFT